MALLLRILKLDSAAVSAAEYLPQLLGADAHAAHLLPKDPDGPFTPSLLMVSQCLLNICLNVVDKSNRVGPAISIAHQLDAPCLLLCRPGWIANIDVAPDRIGEVA